MPPNPPSNAHGFAMRSMSLRDMQIPKSEKKNSWPPPSQILGTPLRLCLLVLQEIDSRIQTVEKTWALTHEGPSIEILHTKIIFHKIPSILGIHMNLKFFLSDQLVKKIKFCNIYVAVGFMVANCHHDSDQ